MRDPLVNWASSGQLCRLFWCVNLGHVSTEPMWTFFPSGFASLHSVQSNRANLEVSFNMESQWTRVWGDSLGVLWALIVNGPREWHRRSPSSGGLVDGTWSSRKQFFHQKNHNKKNTQIIFQHQWSSGWGNFDILTPNNDLISKGKWFWWSSVRQYIDPQREVLFFNTYICIIRFIETFFCWHFQPNLFLCVFTCHSKAFYLVYAVGGVIAALSDPENLCWGGGSNSNYYIYMYFLFVSGEFFCQTAAFGCFSVIQPADSPLHIIAVFKNACWRGKLLIRLVSSLQGKDSQKKKGIQRGIDARRRSMVILNDDVRGIVFVFELSRVFMTRFCLFVFLIFLSEPQIIFLNNALL